MTLNQINFTVIAVFSFFLLTATGNLSAQSFHEVGLTDPSITASKEYAKLEKKKSADFKIYQVSSKIIKFEVPEVSNLKIALYDRNDNLVRTYIYNNLTAGAYEINIGSGNIKKGKYTCVMYSLFNQESSQIKVE